MAVSITLVAGALVGTAATVSVSSNLERATRETRSATRAGSLLMERVRSADFDTVVDDFHGQTVDVAELLGAGYEGGNSTASVSIREIDNGSTRWTLYQVTVTVSTDQLGTTRDVELVTYVSDRANSSASLGGTGSTEPDEELLGDSLAAAAAALDAEGTEPVADTGTETDPGTGTDAVNDSTVVVEETASRGKSGDAPGQNK